MLRESPQVELFENAQPEEPEDAATTFDDDDDHEEPALSKFWQTMHQRKKDAQNEKQRIEAQEQRLRIQVKYKFIRVYKYRASLIIVDGFQKLEQIPHDPLYGNRIHSWVLLITDDKSVKFIEPSNGIIYEQISQQYITIESVWNHENYWVNMKPNILVQVSGAAIA